jgi:hypothetical protein
LQKFQRLNAKAQSREASKVVHDSPQSLHQPRGVQIHEQPKSFVRERQIGEELRGVNRQDFLNGRDLHDKFLLNQQIQAVPMVDLQLAVLENRHQLLGHYMQTVLPELVNEADAVDALRKAWPPF